MHYSVGSARARSGFTLIELIVVISIIGVLFVGSYLPYDYYSRLSRVRISSEKVRQTLEDAKILSQNGQLFPDTTKNANIWLLLRKGSHTISMFAFTPGTRSFSETAQAKIIKTVSLEDGIYITALPKDTMIVEYTAPKWTTEIYVSPTETGSTFQMGIGWKQVSAWPLYKSIEIGK